MIALLQRVGEARVEIGGEVAGKIGPGLLIFLGIEAADEASDIEWLIGKVTKMRIFNDAEGKMNASLQDVGGSVLVVSQFTLHASTKKGNRPSYMKAAPPSISEPLYESFVEALKKELADDRVATGRFGADMQVHLLNDGPVTISIDSRDRK